MILFAPSIYIRRYAEMEINEYNRRKYHRKRLWYRIRLGLEQFLNYPVLNIIWLLFGIGVVFLAIGERKLTASLEVASILEPIFVGSLNFLVAFFSIICAIGIIQSVGDFTARKDEGNMNIVFGDRCDVKQQSPILISKKKVKKKNVVVREFYTTIPMERWHEKKESIADILNVSIVGEIEYGGKYDGNKILLKTIQGRKIVKKDVLYDDTF